jgi:hypothetical protein
MPTATCSIGSEGLRRQEKQVCSNSARVRRLPGPECRTSSLCHPLPPRLPAKLPNHFVNGPWAGSIRRRFRLPGSTGGVERHMEKELVELSPGNQNRRMIYMPMLVHH